jgi:hypothetical protein
MVIVAGPPGSGKTTRFPVTEFGVDSFNADYRAAQLNAGSFRGISKEIRSQVNVEFQSGFWSISPRGKALLSKQRFAVRLRLSRRSWPGSTASGLQCIT